MKNPIVRIMALYLLTYNLCAVHFQKRIIAILIHAEMPEFVLKLTAPSSALAVKDSKE